MINEQDRVIRGRYLFPSLRQGGVCPSSHHLQPLLKDEQLNGGHAIWEYVLPSSSLNYIWKTSWSSASTMVPTGPRVRR